MTQNIDAQQTPHNRRSPQRTIKVLLWEREDSDVCLAVLPSFEFTMAHIEFFTNSQGVHAEAINFVANIPSLAAVGVGPLESESLFIL